MPPAEFEPAIPTTERPQNYVLDREATEFGNMLPFLQKRVVQ